ncbi:hypothetical protein P3S67_004822 [Capsicum chacoense]
MDGETPFKRVTRGIEHVDKTNYGTPSFDLGVSQLDSGNVRFKEELEEDKLKAETQRKSGDDNVNIRNSKDSSFVITDLPKKSPYVACYVQMKLFDTLKQKLSSVHLRRFMGTCFGQYATMPESWVQSQLFRCAMSLELKTSSTHDIMLRFNKNMLRFSLRNFAIISGLNCVAFKGDFVFDTSVPNRLIQTYFDGEKEP